MYKKYIRNFKEDLRNFGKYVRTVEVLNLCAHGDTISNRFLFSISQCELGLRKKTSEN